MQSASHQININHNVGLKNASDMQIQMHSPNNARFLQLQQMGQEPNGHEANKIKGLVTGSTIKEGETEGRFSDLSSRLMLSPPQIIRTGDLSSNALRDINSQFSRIDSQGIPQDEVLAKQLNAKL